MKLDVVKTAVAVLLGALVAYMLSFCGVFAFVPTLPLICGIEFSIILTVALGLELSWMRTMANIRIVSWLFFVALLALNLILAFVCLSMPFFIIANGFATLIYILIVYSLGKNAKK